jgi:hypothetical protein
MQALARTQASPVCFAFSWPSSLASRARDSRIQKRSQGAPSPVTWLIYASACSLVYGTGLVLAGALRCVGTWEFLVAGSSRGVFCSLIFHKCRVMQAALPGGQCSICRRIMNTSKNYTWNRAVRGQTGTCPGVCRCSSLPTCFARSSLPDGKHLIVRSVPGRLHAAPMTTSRTLMNQ